MFNGIGNVFNLFLTFLPTKGEKRSSTAQIAQTESATITLEAVRLSSFSPKIQDSSRILVYVMRYEPKLQQKMKDFHHLSFGIFMKTRKKYITRLIPHPL